MLWMKVDTRAREAWRRLRENRLNNFTSRIWIHQQRIKELRYTCAENRRLCRNERDGSPLLVTIVTEGYDSGKLQFKLVNSGERSLANCQRQPV